MKIIDSFIFYNELDLLNYRLNILKDVVDYFIIVESTHTFAGKEKALFYLENKNLFEKFTDKIIHIVVDDVLYKYPDINYEERQQWKNEIHQRNSIELGLKHLNMDDNDLIIISDVDEIPDPNTMVKIKNNEIKITINSLEMDLYYYNINTRFNDKWILPKITQYRTYLNLSISIEDVRNRNCEKIEKGGWHLSYFGDAIFIKNKIENFSHYELNTDSFTNLDKINNRIKNNSDLFDRVYPTLKYVNLSENDYLPNNYEKYLCNYYNKPKYCMLSIGILTYNAPKTLEYTLNTYKKSGLVYLTDDLFVVIQESDKQPEEKNICDSFGLRCILLPDNGNMASGFKAIYENAKYEHLLFLENDFVINSNESDTKKFFENCLYFLTNMKYDYIRGRNRFDAGEPNYAYDNLKHICPSVFINHFHLSESIYWLDNPELIYPSKIERISPLKGEEKWYKSTSKHCAYTNNPYLCSKGFFKENILPFLRFGSNIEDDLTKIWSERNHNCIFGPGLFTHYRKFE